MKFLFTAPRYHTNQVPVVKGLLEKGHEVKYFVVYEGKIEDHTFCKPVIMEPSGVTKKEIKQLQKIYDENEAVGSVAGKFIPDFNVLKQTIEEYNPDIVICRENNPFTLYVNNLCCQNQIPCIMYNQLPLFTDTNVKVLKSVKRISLVSRIEKKLNRYLIPEYRMIAKLKDSTAYPKVRITPVKYALNSEQHVAAKGSYYVPLVYSPDEKSLQKIYCKDSKVHFLVVGKFREYKNLPYVIKAFSYFANRNDWCLTLVGQVSNIEEQRLYEAVKNSIAAYSLSENIKIKVNVDYSDMQVIYANHDVLILPSKWETYGMVIIEAMASGLAVIVSATCGAAFCAKEAGNGIIDSANVDTLKNAINDILNNPESVENQGHKNYQYILEEQRFDKYYEDLSIVLNQEFNVCL